MKKIYLFLLSFLFGTSIGTQAQLLEKIRNYAKAGSIFSESKQISSKRKAPMANDISFHCDYADCTNAIEYNYLANANGNYCNELVIVAKNSDNQGFQLVFTRPNDNLVGYYEGGECSEIECPYPDTYGLYLATYSNRLWRCPGAPAVCCYNTSGSNVVGVYSYILDGNGNKINIRRGSITVEENNVGGVFMETSGVTNYNNAGQSIYFTFGNRTENHLDYGEGVMYHNGKVLDISNDLNNSYNKTHLTINTSDITGSFTKEDFDLTKTAVYFKGSAVTISKISATVSFSDGVYTLNATIRDDKENVYFLKMMPRLGTMLTENIDMTDNTGLLADQYFQMTGSANGYDMTLGINATSIVGDFTLANVNIAKTSITKDGMELNLSSASISVSYDHNYYHLGLSFVDNDNNTHYLTAFYSVCATDPTPDASWGSFSSDKGDKVKFDELSDNGDVYIWAYDEDHFFRVRASSSRRETQNYVTLCFFTPDGQQYADGFGPKAGTYKVETLDVYEYQGYYYWCFQNESNVDYGSALPGYAYHTSLGVCRFGSYGGNIDKDGYVNEIMGMEGATVTVAPGKDGNIYIKIGNDITTALTIGSAVQLHKIDTYVIGEGTVLLDGECPYNVGDKVELIPTPATGYTFAYWQGVDASSIVEEDGRYYITVEDKDYSVIAVFEEAEDTYTLTWDFNGGVTVSQNNEYTHGKIPEGEFIVAPADPTLDGYQFAGWLNSVTNVVETAEAGMMPSLMPDEDLTYIAQWTANACAYTVSFAANGGSGTMTDQEFTCGVADNLIPNEFIGPAATITYNYHGATSGDETPSVTVNKPFGVWEGPDEDVDDEAEVNFSASNGGTITLIATWNAFPSVTLPTPEKAGYSFNGWYTEETGGTLKGDGGADYVPAGDITLHAQWTANTYTVHFDSNHGEAADEMGDQTFTYGEEQALTANGYEWTGHTFLGWATEENGDVVYTDQQTVSNLTAENDAMVNLYAVWETNNYTITFQDTEADGGHVWWSGSFAYGETPVYGGENEPSKESTDEYTYTFTGWTDGVNEYPVGTALPEVTDNAIYYAVYSESDALFTVRFENPDGSELQTYQLPLGATPAYEGTPAQENEGDAYNYYMFTFTGWVDGDDNSYGTDDALPAVTGDITYTAQYSKQLFIILQEQKDDDYYTEFSEKYNGERAINATLVRQFTQGKWATLCLPFNVSKALMTAVGLQNRVYEFKYTKGDAATGITLYFALATKLEAGKGYIVNANAVLAQKTQLVFYSVLVDTKADIQSGYDISALSGYNSEGNIYLVGTLRRGVLYGDQGNGNYYLGLSNNKIFAANSTTGTNVLAYRGIFRSTEPISAPRVRIVAEGEDGEIVGELEVVNGELEEVAGTRKYVQDGILYIERDGIRYSAQGQRLD